LHLTNGEIKTHQLK